MTTQFRAIAFGRGTFVAVGDSGRRLTSTDGQAWTNDTGEGSANLTAIAYGNMRFVAVGVGGRRVRSIDGGETWDSDVSGGGDLYAVAYGNGVFVAVGNGQTLTSPDGATWTPRSSPANLFSITFGAGKFVAMGPEHASYTSTNGIDWTTHDNGTLPNSLGFSGVAFGELP